MRFKKIVNKLFLKYVTSDEKSFADNLYVNLDQAREMISERMYFGSHGYDHLWLNQHNKSTQEKEINKSLKFLNSIGSSTKDWTMCYPYGSFNQSLIQLLKKKDCLIGVTTENKVATLNNKNRFKLPRVDTAFL